MRVATVQVIRFTGRSLLGWGVEIDATCIVRNEENGYRKPGQVVRTMGSTTPHGLAYQPRPFPAGTWSVTDIVDMSMDTVYWPRWIATDAHQELTVWDVDEQGRYLAPTDDTVIGKGYGLHHARYWKGTELVPSGSTLGCINILDPADAEWLATEIRAAVGNRLHVCLYVPPWDEWEAA